MVVTMVLLGLLLFGGYAGVTGRFAADSRDPEFGWRWSAAGEPAQQVTYGARQLAAQPGARSVGGCPVVERAEIDVEDGAPNLAGVGLVRQLAG